jgi:hypothetical protein
MIDEQEKSSLENERRFASLEKNVAIIMSNYATKEDLAKLETQLTCMGTQMAHMEMRLVKWVVGSMAASIVGVIGTALSVAKLFIG